MSHRLMTASHRDRTTVILNALILHAQKGGSFIVDVNTHAPANSSYDAFMSFIVDCPQLQLSVAYLILWNIPSRNGMISGHVMVVSFFALRTSWISQFQFTWRCYMRRRPLMKTFLRSGKTMPLVLMLGRSSRSWNLRRTQLNWGTM